MMAMQPPTSRENYNAIMNKIRSGKHSPAEGSKLRSLADSLKKQAEEEEKENPSIFDMIWGKK